MKNKIAAGIILAIAYVSGLAIAASILPGCAALQSVAENPEVAARELRLAAEDLRSLAAVVRDPDQADRLEVVALYLDDVAEALETDGPAAGPIEAAREIIAIALPQVGEDGQVFLLFADAVLRRLQAYN